MPRPRSALAAWLLLLVYTAVGVLGGQGLVLCVGPSGHLAIEAKAAGDCDGCVVEPGEERSEPAVSDAEACPCEDIALPGAGVASHASAASRSIDLAWKALPLAVPGFDPIPIARAAPFALDRFSRAERASSTRSRGVVLLV